MISLARSTCQYRIKREPDAEFETQVKGLAFAESALRLPARPPRAAEAKWASGQREAGAARGWQKFDLQVPRDGEAKETASGAPHPVMPQATRPNEVWTYDFMFDRARGGQTLKVVDVDGRIHQRRFGASESVARFKAAQVKEV